MSNKALAEVKFTWMELSSRKFLPFEVEKVNDSTNFYTTQSSLCCMWPCVLRCVLIWSIVFGCVLGKKLALVGLSPCSFQLVENVEKLHGYLSSLLRSLKIPRQKSLLRKSSALRQAIFLSLVLSWIWAAESVAGVSVSVFQCVWCVSELRVSEWVSCVLGVCVCMYGQNNLPKVESREGTETCLPKPIPVRKNIQRTEGTANLSNGIVIKTQISYQMICKV